MPAPRSCQDALLIEAFFDAFLYTANWGASRVVLRSR